MDKSYVGFYRLFNFIHVKRAFFVTRAKDNMAYQVEDSFEVDKDAGLISDQSIRLTGVKSSKLYSDNIKLVVYEDYATNNVYHFLTNNFELSSLTIAELYRERWKVELFFKWIKQHLHIKAFYGTTSNAVYCQIWIAICTYLLLANAKKNLNVKENLYIFSQTIGLTLFEREFIRDLFNYNINFKKQPDDNQLSLWKS
ncbi:IS4 family transposase [Bacteroides sp.]|uniref:IS4 family transposase n=1 Tax=Bacteroides sp. TaxID=29523 RepID=UPI001B429233|nr:IS4 family transposase [Bacteroides sp.]MBP8621804.1 IS4 family transposase [Bacteroides sp.]